MGDNSERRSYDEAINQIALDVNTVMVRQEEYIKQIDKCEVQTKTNTAAIGTLKTKMGFVIGVGTVFIGTGFSVLGRWIYKQL